MNEKKCYHKIKGGDQVSDTKLTTDEARKLVEMIKRSLVTEVKFPDRGGKIKFDVIGDTKKDVFTIDIYRGKINPYKYDMGALIKKNGTMLLQLHISPSNVHTNPDGQKIVGNHWHVYTEEYGRAFAFPAEDISADEFVDNTISFLTKFNVVEQPNVLFQLELL